jgi:hypothetical protein
MFERFRHLFRRKPGMVGSPASARQVPADAGLHAVDFAHRYAVELERLVEGRMHALEVPEEMIGHPDPSRGLPWAAFHPAGTTGGSIVGRRIAINSGVLNPGLLADSYGPNVAQVWADSRLRDRIDAVIAHEAAEARTGTHAGAEQLAAETDLPVSDAARRILRAIAGRTP